MLKQTAGLAAVIGVVAACCSTLATAAPDGFETIVSKDGAIKLPDADYRALWQYLGSWSVLADEPEQGVKSIHIVYTQPGVIEAYRDAGSFPDGAVLLKEVIKSKTNDMTTGTVSWPQETEGWFVMVKDAKGRFKENPLWGNGWGWAWFGADAPDQTTTEDYKSECLGCHIPAKNSDWVYVQGYQALRSK